MLINKEKKINRRDVNILFGPQIWDPKIRELLKGKYEIILKTKVHGKMN